MRFSPEHLETLAAVVAEGTFDAAARRLGVTPGAVSQRVTALERSVGRVVVVRSKPVRPTAIGEVLLRHARQVHSLERDVLADLGSDADPGAGADAADAPRTVLPIAVNADSLATWILPPLARAAERLPVAFDLVRDDEGHTAELLRDGTVMAAVSSDASPVPGCRVVRLGRMRYRPMATPAFAARWFPDGLDAASLDRAPLIEFDRKDQLQLRFARRVARRQVDPPRHWVPASSEFAEAARLGLGWAMLPRWHSEQPEARGELVDLAPGRSIDVVLHWQQWNLPGRLLDAVADEIRAEARAELD